MNQWLRYYILFVSCFMPQFLVDMNKIGQEQYRVIPGMEFYSQTFIE